jgi:hypothetical protein
MSGLRVRVHARRDQRAARFCCSIDEEVKGQG